MTTLVERITAALSIVLGLSLAGAEATDLSTGIIVNLAGVAILFFGLLPQIQKGKEQ